MTKKDVDAYLKDLPADRKVALTAIRKVILERLPKGYEESLEFGMPSYQVPLSVYPDTYNEKPLMYIAATPLKELVAFAKSIHDR